MAHWRASVIFNLTLKSPMITGTISANDYLNAQKLHRKKAVRWYYAASCIALVIGLGLLILAQSTTSFMLIGAGLGGMVGEFAVSSILLPWKVRRIHRQQKDLASPFTYSWNSEFLEAQGASGHARRAWKNYAKYRENEKVFLLYHADNLFEMLPKNWFRDQAQMNEFRAYAEQAGSA